MAHKLRAEFDRRRDFLATKPFTYAAIRYVPGHPIPKEQFSDRRLRQMYEQGRIGFAPMNGAKSFEQHLQEATRAAVAQAEAAPTPIARRKRTGGGEVTRRRRRAA